MLVNFFLFIQIIVEEFEKKLNNCLVVNDSTNAQNEDEDGAPRRINVPVVKRPGRGKSTKDLPTRQSRKSLKLESSSSDSEVENQPPRRQKGRKVERMIESESDEEPVVQKRASASASRGTKVIQESTSSGKKCLSLNNSF